MNREEAYKQGYEEYINKAIPVILNGRAYKIHRNINFYIDLTSNCTCDCSFCIAKTKYDRKTNDKTIQKMPGWVNQALEILAPCNTSIQIVGGEPTIYPETIIKIMDIVKKHKIRNPVLGTNGAYLNSEIGSKFNHINVSRHHYNDFKNEKIMNGGINTNMLQENMKSITDKIRMQCNLLHGEIDTYGEVMQFIAYAYHKFDIKNIVFAALTPLPRNSFYKAEIIDYCESMEVDIDTILETIARDSNFIFKKSHGGVACYYEIWEYMAYGEPVTVQFKFSNNFWLEKADDNELYIPDFILHTNGNLCGSWDRNKKIIKEFR